VIEQIRVLRALLTLCLVVAPVLASSDNQPGVSVSSVPVGPRALEKETETAVVRGYLEAWQTLSQALADNNPDLLDAAFVGIAKQKLAGTIEDQRKLGIQTRYQDRAHDIKLLFYSPEGLSIQLADTVEYDLEILDQGKLQATQHVRTRYLAVLTPTEVRWKVRVFQATRDPENATIEHK